MKEKILIIEDDFTIQTQLKTLGEYSTRRVKRNVISKKVILLEKKTAKIMRDVLYKCQANTEQKSKCNYDKPVLYMEFAKNMYIWIGAEMQTKFIFIVKTGTRN